MEKRGGGTIIGVSGADTRTYIPAHGVLAGAKAAMESMIQYLACEIGQRGITILGVNPGTIMGDSIRLMVGEELFEQAWDFDARTHPLRTAATPADIAEPIRLALLTDGEVRPRIDDQCGRRIGLRDVRPVDG